MATKQRVKRDTRQRGIDIALAQRLPDSAALTSHGRSDYSTAVIVVELAGTGAMTSQLWVARMSGKTRKP